MSWAIATNALGAPQSPHVWDRANTLTLRMQGGDEPETATEAQVLNGANAAAVLRMDGTAEIIRFAAVTDNADGTITLGTLLRGRFGTEHLAGGHRAGAAVLMLDSPALPFPVPQGKLGVPVYLRFLGRYDTLNTAPTVTLVPSAAAEKPWSPASIAGERDGSGNLSMTWLRRTRFGGEWINGTGTVPLNEASEAYEVDVMSGPPAVARTYSADAGAAANAFDGDAGTEWVISTGSLPRYVQAAFAAPQAVGAYAIRARAIFAGSDTPRGWSLQARNPAAGAAWAVIDTRAAEGGWSDGEVRTYTLAAPASATEFRLVVTEGNGGSNTGLAELELHAAAGGANITASSYAPTVVRAITGLASAAAAYSAADQAADFGAAQAAVAVRVFQISAAVGRGHAGEATI